ncbi:MAG: DnaB-like helicase C-terminal domain-containing protein, partial [candidate division WOR-3 bacterium]
MKCQTERISPANLEVEEAILGAALICSKAAKTICEEAAEDHFYSDKHRLIFTAIKTLQDNRRPVDLVILTDYLKQQKNLESVGGAGYLSRLLERCPTTANLQAHISILKDKAARRATIKECANAINDSYGEKPTADILADLHRTATNLITECSEKDYLSGKDLALVIEQDINDKATSGVSCTGISTGFTGLDDLIGGFDKGQLITVGGVTGGGKTTVMLDFAHSIAIKNRNCAVYFSVEMGVKEIGYKLLPKITGMEAQKVKRATLTEEETQKLEYGIVTLRDSPILIDDTPNIRLIQLAAKLRRLKAREGVKIAFVDYLQIVRNQQKGQSRFEEVASLALGLKGLARELDLPIVVGAQINRDYKQRQDKRPMVDDIRE